MKKADSLPGCMGAWCSSVYKAFYMTKKESDSCLKDLSKHRSKFIENPVLINGDVILYMVLTRVYFKSGGAIESRQRDVILCQNCTTLNVIKSTVHFSWSSTGG